ncbi:redoxin domain-containing protein, partial [Flavobacteriales bacterium]|nr:redoxin domain-containing protein [Flavobacteriales bacterium]
MKKLLLLLSVFAFTFSNAQSGLLNGTGYAPNFTVTDLNGVSHTVYDYLDSGKVVVLELLSVTCGHCISHAAGTEASHQTNGPNGTDVARFLGLEVNASTDSTAVANFASTYGVTFPIANNVSPTAINYQLYYTPGYYIIYPDSSYTTICAAYCVTTQNYSTIEGLLNTAIAAWMPPVYGCTDSLAVNYDPFATVDNDSCDYTSYTITTVGMSFTPDTIVCDVGDTINFILGGYHNAVEVSDSTWLSGGTTSNGGFSFGFGATGMFIPDDCHTFYYVCQPHAFGGMKGVIIAHHPPVFGCTDSTASNYDSTATVDDGSCIFLTYVPDDNFEQELINSGYDNVLDDYVLTANIDTLTWINIANANISDLTGIEDFIMLKDLSCWNNPLTIFDISNNTALEILNCSDNQLTTIDISNNINLHTISCGSNTMTSINFGTNSSLESLSCGWSPLLTYIDLQVLVNLKNLQVSATNLISFDVTNNLNLETLSCDWITSITNPLSTLDISNNTQLTNLSCSGNNLDSLDVSYNTNLMALHCDNNNLDKLDLSNNMMLEYLECHNNQIDSLDLSNHLYLKKLHCYYNNLTTLDLSNSNDLDDIRCENNQLEYIDLRNGHNFSTNGSSDWVTTINNPNLFCIDVDNPNDPFW